MPLSPPSVPALTPPRLRVCAGTRSPPSTRRGGRAPSDGWVVSIRSWDRLSETPAFTDYTVDLALCKDVFVRFDHVVALSPGLQAAFAEPFDKTDEYTIAGKSTKAAGKGITLGIRIRGGTRAAECSNEKAVPH